MQRTYNMARTREPRREDIGLASTYAQYPTRKVQETASGMSVAKHAQSSVVRVVSIEFSNRKIESSNANV